MAEEIGLQELMYQVKKELLAPCGTGLAADDPVPLFYVEGVELELSVACLCVSACACTHADRYARRQAARKEGQAGVRLYVVDIGGRGGHERAQTVRVSLRPLYSREEMRRFVEQDPVLGPQLRQAATQGMLKGGLFEE